MEKVAGLTWAIAKAVKEFRESKGLTQGQLAGFAGLSEVFIAKLEQGACGGSLNAFVQIAAALEMPPSELMKAIEMELASGSSKPKGTRGRPNQPAKQMRENSSGQ
jgi:transcriptional regulator with XRE-family HTH domain